MEDVNGSMIYNNRKFESTLTATFGKQFRYTHH